MASEPSAHASSAILRPPEASAYTGISESTLAKKRMEGGGPPFIRLTSRAVGYLRTDLDAFLASRRVKSTSDRETLSASAAA